MNTAFHTTAFDVTQAALREVSPGDPAAPRPRRVDPVRQAWSGLDVTQKSVLAIHGAILLAVSWHGYKRNQASIGWGLLWALGGFMCPTVTLGFALTQGFAKTFAPKED